MGVNYDQKAEVSELYQLEKILLSAEYLKRRWRNYILIEW